MKINKNIKNELKYPSDMDEHCIELYYLLNSLPNTVTFDSCCGHERWPFMMFFRCHSIDVLTRLGRAVSKNYSDGNWEIVVDSVDGEPYGCFLLRTKTVLKKNELDLSLDGLLDSIRYWFSDEFDNYFKNPLEVDNIWHEASETPKGAGDKEILVQFADSHTSVFEIDDWEYLDHQTKWAYLKDLT